MLLFDHYVAPSTIQGLGVFTRVAIAKGTVVYEFNPLIDKEFTKDDLALLPPHVVERIRRHAEWYPDRNIYRLALDGDGYINHSDEPNMDNGGDVVYASRDILPGEEMTCDYRSVRVETYHPEFQVAQGAIA